MHSACYLVQDMETRRDTAENLMRQRILELELKLLKAENVMSLVVAWDAFCGVVSCQRSCFDLGKNMDPYDAQRAFNSIERPIPW